MGAARPTVAPAGRLVRLGVVLDTGSPVERLREVARMCDRAGIGALWVEDPPGGAAADGAGGGLDPWTALALLAGEVRTARVGVVLDAAAWPAGRLARMAATLGAATGGRLELTLRARPAAAAAGVAALRAALAVATVPAPVARGAPGGTGAGGPAYGVMGLPVEPPTIGLLVDPSGGAASGPGGPGGPGGPHGCPGSTAGPAAGLADPAAVAAVDDLVLAGAPLAATIAAALAARRAAALAGRGAATLGVAARLPVSVGRTVAEAQARWDADPALAALGEPAAAGLFGTLEQCHDRVVELAHAGVSDLRCVLPNAIDVHDVIAQLTAMTIGSAERLVPGAPRTRIPEPPPGWGGPSRFPRPG